MNERVVRFGRDRALVGIAIGPEAQSAGAALPALLLLNAGLVHRVGPNRLHVDIARRVARLGFPVLRFDFSGIGDSPASTSSTPFDQRALDEAREAMDFLAETWGIARFVPVGLCSGADVGFALARQDDRVVGAVLINGGLLDADAPAQTLREAQARVEARDHLSRVLNLQSWARLVRGRSDMKAIRRTVVRLLAGRLRARAAVPAPRPAIRELRRLSDREVDVLAVYSEGSTAWDLFNISLGASAQAAHTLENFRLEYVKNCDHLFTPLWAQAHLTGLIVAWATAARSRWEGARAERGERRAPA